MRLVDLRLKAGSQAFFRHRAVGDNVVVTGRDGAWLVLTQDEFRRFAEDTVEPGSALHRRLAEGGFIRAEVDTAKLAERLRARTSFLNHGPNLHIVVATLRCNQTCVYCHASRADLGATGLDMTPEVADAVLDRIFATTNPNVTIEFQGGEPLANFPVVQRIIDGALAKNEQAGKRLDFTLVTNLSVMDEEKLAWLLDKRVQICTSLDGPADLHDHQRKLVGGSAFAETARWIRRINAAYEEQGLDPTLYRVEALPTITRATLPRWKELVDTFVDLGCRALFLRPVDPFGFAARTGDKVDYPRAEYLAFYRSAVDYMLELNAKGVQILERFASVFLTKILSGAEPNFLDLRNPCGAGIGQVAYNYDGKVFTCDEGRMLHASGDATFTIGDVRENTYREMMGHDTVRALALASNLDAQPGCTTCAYNPYCGVCPVHSYRTQGSIFGRMPESTLCMVYMGIQDYLFERLGGGDEAVLETFRKWTTVRERGHFVHACASS